MTSLTNVSVADGPDEDDDDDDASLTARSEFTAGVTVESGALDDDAADPDDVELCFFLSSEHKTLIHCIYCTLNFLTPSPRFPLARALLPS